MILYGCPATGTVSLSVPSLVRLPYANKIWFKFQKDPVYSLFKKRKKSLLSNTNIRELVWTIVRGNNTFQKVLTWTLTLYAPKKYSDWAEAHYRWSTARKTYMYGRDRVKRFQHIFRRPRYEKKKFSVCISLCAIFIPSAPHSDKFSENLGPRKIYSKFRGEVSVLILIFLSFDQY